MRQIKKMILLTLTLMTGPAFSENTLTYEISQNDQKDRNGYLQGDVPTIKKRSSTLNLVIDEIPPFLSFSGTVRFDRPDYSNYTLRGTSKLGGLDIPDPEKDRKLTETDQNATEEVWTNVSLTAAKGPWSFTLGGEKNVSYSPFASTGLNTEASYGFYNQSTVVSLGGQYKESKRPENFFTDETSKMNRLPTTVRERSLSLGVEQVLNETMKAKLYLGLTDKTEERPQNQSIGLRYGVAINDYIYAKAGYRYAYENKNGAQKTESGFFDQHLVETEVTFEPVFDLLVSLSYDMFVEHDDNPRKGTETRLAADQFGLGVNYAWTNYFATNLRTSYMRTNQRQTSYNVLGGIECKL